MNKLYGRTGGQYGPGSTPLHIAVGEGLLDIAETMVKQGADVSIRNGDVRPASIAQSASARVNLTPNRLS